MRRRLSLSTFFIGLVVAGFAVVCVAPMILAIMVSFTDEDTITQFGYSFFPKLYSTYAYRLIFGSGSSVLRSYGISIFVTTVGTLCAVVMTLAAAYTLSNKRVHYRHALAFFFYLPMILTVGIVPWYLICLRLGLKNNIFALIVPNLLFNPFNLFLMKNFMDGIPESLRESATVDGASDIRIAFRIYLPLSVPAIATVSLFYGLAYWNDWWNAIMLVDEKTLYPLQFLLLQLRSQIRMIQDLQSSLMGAGSMTPPAESLKMATAVVTTGPIVLLYPFLQRYFVKGLVVGSVKG